MKQGLCKHKHTPICSFHYMTCGRLDSETDINMFSWKLAIRTSIEQFVANEKAILSRHDSIQSIAVSCHVHMYAYILMHAQVVLTYDLQSLGQTVGFISSTSPRYTLKRTHVAHHQDLTHEIVGSFRISHIRKIISSRTTQ